MSFQLTATPPPMAGESAAPFRAPPLPLHALIAAAQTPPAPKKQIRVVLAHRSPLVRHGVVAALAECAGARVEIVGECASIAAAVELSSCLIPDLAIVDTALPDGTGADACRRLLEKLPTVRILMLSLATDEKPVFEAIMAGAHGYIGSDVEARELAEAIRDVANGHSMLSTEATMAVVRKFSAAQKEGGELGRLSPQERRVLELVARGLTNRQVGQHLQLRPNTVKNYLASVFEKLKVSRRSEAVALFVRAQSNAPATN